MPPGVPNKITSRISSGLLVILLLAIAASLVVIAFVAIDIIDEETGPEWVVMEDRANGNRVPASLCDTVGF